MALVVFLKGINVGGHRRFRPSQLATQLEHLDVVNLGAAGTLIVRQSVTQARLRAELARRLPFDASMAICQGREIVRLIAAQPFRRQPERQDIVRFVSVLSARPQAEPSLPLELPSDADWLLRVLGREGRFVYGIHKRHMKVIGYLGSLDRLFGVPVTTRNWNTITAVASVIADRRA